MIINNQDFSITYPIDEVIRRATSKLKAYDRNIPMGSDMWGGMMSKLVSRWRRFNNWKSNGVLKIKVFYDPTYFVENQHVLDLIDPLHMQYVTKYAGIIN